MEDFKINNDNLLEQHNFQILVLQKLSSIETKLEDYQSYKDKTNEAHTLSEHNKEKIQKLEQDYNNLSTRISQLENKPAKNWNDMIKIIFSSVVSLIVGIVLAKIGLQ